MPLWKLLKKFARHDGQHTKCPVAKRQRELQEAKERERQAAREKQQAAKNWESYWVAIDERIKQSNLSEPVSLDLVASR